MKKEPIKILPYSEINFKFVSDHYDVHLSGTCIYEKKLCEFKNDYPDYNEEKEEFEEMQVRIYRLNFLEKIRWTLKQWLFEECVGYHWSYENGKRGKNFYYRRPKWFYKRLFMWYYQLKK